MNSENRLEEEKQFFIDQEEAGIYRIITGQLKYKPGFFEDEDLKPDLIMKIKIPQDGYILAKQYLPISTLISNIPQKVDRCYTYAEQEIKRQMQVNNQNNDSYKLRIRLQQSLYSISPLKKETTFVNYSFEEEPLQFQCVNRFGGVLDTFTIQYNAIVYMLQKICGFRVKSFILYDQEVNHKQIYLFLTLSAENMMRVANKHRIKKQIQYTFIDFNLNEPVSSDERPIRLSSKLKQDKNIITQYKHLNRYFRIKQSVHNYIDIQVQKDISDSQIQNYRSCSEELQILYEYIKYNQDQILSDKQKSYIFEYNRRKINPGVQNMFDKIKKRRQYFQIRKQILKKYGYPVYEEPIAFQEFTQMDKHSKGATFFNKFQSLMFYKPVIVSQEGDLSLFLNMQRAKLCYIVLKNNFKVNNLSEIGITIYNIDNQFEKNGKKQLKTDIRGGIDGQCLIDKWNFISLFSDMKVIRNFMGQSMAYEVFCINFIFGYLLSVMIPYCCLYAFQMNFGSTSTIFLITNPLEAGLFAVSYSIFMRYMQIQQSEFINNYCDSVSSKIFLSKYRGPYQRNVLTDEINQFQNKGQTFFAYKNIICLILIASIIIVLGVIFYCCRIILLQIYDPLSRYVIGSNSLSLAHIIAYSGYFFVGQILTILLVEKIIDLMVYLQNPSCDEEERQWNDTLSFYFLISYEMIPPFFMLIIEPFNNTSCFSQSCIRELTYYIYSRNAILLFIVLSKLIYLLIYERYRSKPSLKDNKTHITTYQQKLADLLIRAIKESNKPEHIQDRKPLIISLVNHAIYNTILPISSIIMCGVIFLHFQNVRIGILNKQQRPLNKSQSIIKFTKQIKFIYYLGIWINVWISIYSFQPVENRLQFMIQLVQNKVSYQGIFLLKFALFAAYSGVLIFAGTIVIYILGSLDSDPIKIRKKIKLYEYKTSRGGLKPLLKKSKDLIPLTTIFRTTNPTKKYDELNDQQLKAFGLSFQTYQKKQINFQNIGSTVYLYQD